MRLRLVLAALVALGPAVGARAETHSLTVTATAYNGTRAQTDSTPGVGAWGDHLDSVVEPGVRVIAVSRDLLARGLTRGQRVRIHGLKGEFVVMDKMSKRKKNQVDIYMHKDIRGAKKWGRRKVKISWREPGPPGRH